MYATELSVTRSNPSASVKLQGHGRKMMDRYNDSIPKRNNGFVTMADVAEFQLNLDFPLRERLVKSGITDRDEQVRYVLHNKLYQ